MVKPFELWQLSLIKIGCGICFIILWYGCAKKKMWDVQKRRGIHWPLVYSLWGGPILMEHLFQSLWFGLGYASEGWGSLALLVVRGRPHSAVVWKMVPLCIMWCLWSERNERFFEDSERSLEDLLHFFFSTLFTWTAAWLAPIVITFTDFISLFSSPP